ncbi:hypothetical protein B0H11DRAFT_871008 [Mycena galericulata]|nr:hypothetical protein B0H11DRAFT_871008 [Mycena galericulata]
MPALALERDDSNVAHTGHSTSSYDSPTPAGLQPPPPAVSRLSSSASTQLVLSPGQMTPQSSTDLALAAQRGDGVLGGVVGQDGMRTPSLVSGGESGYTASTESGLVETPGSISGSASASAFSPSGFTPSSEDDSTSYGFGVGGSAALNSTRLEDNVPSGDADWRERYASQSQSEGPRAPANSAAEAFMAEVRAGAGAGAGAPSGNFAGLGRGGGGDGEGAKMGSAALNSARYEDNVPTGEEADDEGNVDADVDADAEGEDDDGDDSAQAADGEDQEQGGKGEGMEGKKGKLIKRFKEKMRVGGA